MGLQSGGDWATFISKSPSPTHLLSELGRLKLEQPVLLGSSLYLQLIFTHDLSSMSVSGELGIPR